MCKKPQVDDKYDTTHVDRKLRHTMLQQRKDQVLVQYTGCSTQSKRKTTQAVAATPHINLIKGAIVVSHYIARSLSDTK
jgi:hypothetical protein